MFGAFCIPETSCVASYCSCDQFTAPGDRLRVKVLHIDPGTGQVSATIQGLYQNPWADGRLAPGSEHRARVVRYVEAADRCEGGPGWLLELVPGAFVMLCGGGRTLERGQEVRVVIRESDVTKRAVTIAPANSHRLSLCRLGGPSASGTAGSRSRPCGRGRCSWHWRG